MTAPEEARTGCGPLIASSANQTRPLRLQIFERIRAEGLTPRTELAKQLEVSPASVTNITSKLIAEGYLIEAALPRDLPDGGRGRPPIGLCVRGEAHHVVGIKFSEREHTAALVDFAGELLAQTTIPSAPGQMPVSTLLDAAEALLDNVCSKGGVSRGSISAVGIGLPGLLDHAAGIVHWSPILKEQGLNLVAAAEKRLAVPVTADNDANLVALAELWFGVGRRMMDFAVVTIEHGVGLGLVLNHRVYRGARGLGLELGHTKVQLDGALCRCGQRGCLEAYVADYALVREAETALNWNPEESRPNHLMLETLFDHAKADNAAARSIFRRAGRYLAIGIANVINMLDPSLIILSGERMRYDYLYAAEMLAEIETHTLAPNRGPTPVEVHAWGDLLWARGAAALALAFITESSLAAPREIAAQ